MPEQWRPVPGYEDLYEVSDLGNVRSLPRKVTFFNSRGEAYERGSKGKSIKVQIDQHGYRRAPLHRNGTTKNMKVAKLVAAAFIGPRPTGMVVCHRNNNKQDDTPDNLRYGTQKSNLEDQKAHGVARVGEKHGCAKLTATAVIEIRGRHPNERIAKLAREYGVSHSQVSRIVNNKAWTHGVL